MVHTRETVRELISSEREVSVKTFRNGGMVPTGAVAPLGELAAMRGVCALFQAQTMDERASRSVRHQNGVGFSGCHAAVGTILAEWMTVGRGDGQFRRRCGGMMWFRNERMSRVDVCKIIAHHHAAQLAKIANKKAAVKIREERIASDAVKAERQVSEEKVELDYDGAILKVCYY